MILLCVALEKTEPLSNPYRQKKGQVDFGRFLVADKTRPRGFTCAAPSIGQVGHPHASCGLPWYVIGQSDGRCYDVQYKVPEDWRD